jgi:hypothetical protein
MFNQPVDIRLTEWIAHRRELDKSKDPLQDVWDFWNQAPFTPHNRNIDPYYQKSWPTPWEIIEINKYDDFTKALMIGWTLKLTKKFKDSKIEIKTLVDDNRTREYNVIYIDNSWVINYNDNGPILAVEVNEQFKLENIIEVTGPR